MQHLTQEIERLTGLLKKVDASTLVHENLAAVEEGLKDNTLIAQIQQFKRSIPPEPEDAFEKEKQQGLMRKQADQMNHEADAFLDELERIKRIRQTLNLEALDPIIREAKTIIHRVHGLTGEFQ